MCIVFIRCCVDGTITCLTVRTLVITYYTSLTINCFVNVRYVGIDARIDYLIFKKCIAPMSKHRTR